MSETRTTYWWTLKQIRDAGHTICGSSDNTVQYGDSVWERVGPGERIIGLITTKNERRHGPLGAWLPEPPPPEEMGDKEVGVFRTDAVASAKVGRLYSRTPDWLEAVLDAAIAYVHARENPDTASVFDAAEDLARTLRRRPR